MRIAYLINSMEGGGAQSPLPQIIGSLRQAGAEVRVFALTRRNGLAIPRLLERGIEPVVREGGEKDHPAALRWITQQVHDWRADVLWTSLTRATLLGQIAGQRFKLPVVSWQHNAFLKPWNERILRWRAAASDIWVADSAQVADLTRNRLDIAAKDVVTWPIFAANPDAPQSRSWTEGEMLRIGSLGRLHPAKGYDILIAALAQLQSTGFEPAAKFQITIGGIGKDEAQLKSQAAAAGLDTIRFAGFVEDPAAFLADQHLYLQPSRREGFCIAAHEAMQAGLPVIVSQTGEMPFTVDDPAIGLAVPVGNVPALAEALGQMLSQPLILKDMGHRARERVLEKFSQSHFDEIGAALVGRIRHILAER
ncbi:glycosyltransferase family 4 protein [Aurantiacibacter marinus]|uniref:Glycosyl transferase family 1 n=1 Tax=Aurantiacibacter marinus TaxID=874156 RepID=A0A0H0XNT3_9SPHN|nr:glycosyltransferase family 4 protein [Aurantiacibacter marinus]KLI63994.1 glycosyl transferase family 1 [Aurantiacibacter marinus]